MQGHLVKRPALKTVAGYEAMHAIRKGQTDSFPEGMLSVRSNSSSGSSALSLDHGLAGLTRGLSTLFATDPGLRSNRPSRPERSMLGEPKMQIGVLTSGRKTQWNRPVR
jgi:hypothetical protein